MHNRSLYIHRLYQLSGSKRAVLIQQVVHPVTFLLLYLYAVHTLRAQLVNFSSLPPLLLVHVLVLPPLLSSSGAISCGT